MSSPTVSSEFISRALPLTIAAEREAFVQNARSSERLLVTVYATQPRMRGYLDESIFDAIEHTLREHGAPAVDRGMGGTFAQQLDDAIYRSGLIGSNGLAIEIENLSAISDVHNTLHPDDGRTLSQWLDATQSHAVQLLLPPSVRTLKVFPDAVPLDQLLPLSTLASLPAVIEYEKATSTLDPAARALLESSDEDAAPPSLLPPSWEAFALAEDAAEEAEEAEETKGTDDPHDFPLEQCDASSEEEIAVNDSVAQPLELLEPMSLPSLAVTAEDSIDAGWDEPIAAAEPQEVASEPAPAPQREKTIAPETFTQLRDLEATRGPKALSVIERLYTTTFVPLQRAVHAGQAPAGASAVLEEWSHSFAKSYKEAFEALKQRGRRPTMIMDLPEIAHRLARLHGARHVQLLMVDGMSFDLGQRVNERLQKALQGRAACAERMMLWSGLPATTATQLELLGRGHNALREFTGEIDDEMVVNRGRTASSIRRIRTGHRELWKLDLVEAKLIGPGAPVEQRMNEIADDVSEALAAHIAGQPHGSLLLVFGDHGFIFELDERGGTVGVRAPSAQVEEVLTPAFAWLTGVH